MYHIASDIRAKKSADLIIQGLEECLQEKPLDKIKVIDIYNKTYVSRATFYRLFDNIYSKQKEQKTIEEIVDHTDKMIATIVDMWNIGR